MHRPSTVRESVRAPRKVLLIMTDTQPTRFVGAYGNGAVCDTPNLDRLARGGTRFDRAYTACPLCTPARSAIFTGLFPASNGALANESSPARHIPLLGERVIAAGVRFGYTGKWHLDGAGYHGAGVSAGGASDRWWFDGRRYIEWIGEARYTELAAAARRGDADALEAAGLTEQECWAYQVAERAKAFLTATPRTEPFVFVASFDEPHGPFICPPAYIRRFEEARIPPPSSHGEPVRRGRPDTRPALQRRQSAEYPVGSADAFARERVKHMACNAWVDRQIGRVLDAADEAHGDELLVIFTSDHGDMHGAHGLRSKGAMMYEETIRVPFVISVPRPSRGKDRPAVVKEPVGHLDIVPTILDYLGLAIPQALHGRSVLPLLHGRDESVSAPIAADTPGRRDGVMVQFSRFGVFHDGLGEWYPIRCLVTPRWKLVVNLFDLDELYDLHVDPDEECNLLFGPAVRDDIRRRAVDLLRRLDAEMERTFDPLRGPPWRERPWAAEDTDIGGDDRRRPSTNYGTRRKFFGESEHAPPTLAAAPLSHYRTVSS